MSSLLLHYETIDFDNCSMIDPVDTIIEASNRYYSIRDFMKILQVCR